MPDGGARSATLERMSAVSLTGVVRGRNACADHSVFTQVVDTYRLAVGSPLSLLTFFAAAKKVSAAPHRGKANRPIPMQGKANTARKHPNQGAAGKTPHTLQLRPNQIPSNNPLTPHLRGSQRLDLGNKRPNLPRPIEWKQHLPIGLANHLQDTKKPPIPGESGRSRDFEITLGLRWNTGNECRLAHTSKRGELGSASAHDHVRIAADTQSKPALSQIFTHRE
jgi:hypothetical protein